MSCKISVIVPIYQVEDYIHDCIQSLCSQTFKEFKLILIDDGSTDNSIKVAENILKDSGLDYFIIRKKNGGLPSARNSGFEHANTEWVVSIDSDDVVHPTFIEILLKTVENSPVNLAFCDWNIVTKENKHNWSQVQDYQSTQYSRIRFQKLFLVRKIIPVIPTMIINKRWLISNNLRLDETCYMGGDAQFIWKMSFYLDKIVHIKTPLYNYFVRKNSIMTSPNVNKIESGYHSMKKLELLYPISKNNHFINYIIPRWVFGVATTTARYSNYADYMTVSKKCDARISMHKLFKFPDIRIRLLSVLYVLSPRFFYFLFNFLRRVRL